MLLLHFKLHFPQNNQPGRPFDMASLFSPTWSPTFAPYPFPYLRDTRPIIYCTGLYLCVSSFADDKHISFKSLLGSLCKLAEPGKILSFWVRSASMQSSPHTCNPSCIFFLFRPSSLHTCTQKTFISRSWGLNLRPASWAQGRTHTYCEHPLLWLLQTLSCWPWHRNIILHIGPRLWAGS